MTTYKSGVLGAIIAVLTLLTVACQPDSDGPRRERAFRQDGAKSRLTTTTPGDGGSLDLGENWDAAHDSASADGTPSIDSTSGPSTIWTIVLRTFTGDGHRQAATNMLQSCASIDPKLAAARIHTTSKGSMVVFGAHDDPKSSAAQSDLQWVKSITFYERPVFPRAMYTRINLRHARGEFKPGELIGVRMQYPDVDPLYTLQIAVWGDFGSGRLAPEETQKRAEDYARQLRAQGLQAFFHHDEDQNLSMVTVGLFDKTALDPQSGLYSFEVEQLLKRFPEHLVNGEPLLEPLDSKHPQLGTRLQKPRLVLVPKL